MAKFSVGGDDDGEGPSNPSEKRRRLTVRYGSFAEDELEVFENQSGTEEEEGDEEEEEAEEGEETEQERETLRSDQEQDVDEEEYFTGFDEPTSIRPRSHGSGGENINMASDDRNRSVSIILTDPEVLDCCICYEPLSVPVFQCENGHIACSSCCIKLGNKCPFCSMPIGYNRCRAIEKVLESVKISCLNAKYGCKETLSYSKKNDHEKECIYAPCLCPYPSCDIVASSKELSLHFSLKHVGSAIHFSYDHYFSVSLNESEKVTVLQEQNDGKLFVVNNNVELLGNLVHVSCIGPDSSEERFHYDLWAKSEGWHLKLQSFTKNNQGRIANTQSTGFLLIPYGFFGSRGRLKLEIRIRRNVTQPAGVHHS